MKDAFTDSFAEMLASYTERIESMLNKIEQFDTANKSLNAKTFISTEAILAKLGVIDRFLECLALIRHSTWLSSQFWDESAGAQRILDQGKTDSTLGAANSLHPYNSLEIWESRIAEMRRAVIQAWSPFFDDYCKNYANQPLSINPHWRTFIKRLVSTLKLVHGLACEVSSALQLIEGPSFEFVAHPVGIT